MKEQIEEMQNELCTNCKQLMRCSDCVKSRCTLMKVVDILYNAGYRKQKEGEWIKHEESIWEHRYWCSVCNFYRIGAPTPHCQNCGAHMKGGAE